MNAKGCLILSVAVAGSLMCRPAAGSDASAQRRMEALEKRQQQLNEELRRLRDEIERPRAEQPAGVELERRQGILTEEVRRLREALSIPETKELKSAYGMGPAASKVYGLSRGLSIGGYGEANFRNVVSDRNGARDEFDFLRFVLYAGYKFNDWIVFNSETEFEHATTGSTVSADRGSVSVEFAAIDFLLHPMANLRAGMVLVPMGFINEVHEPPFFHGNSRPEVELQVLPSTWRANGVGLHGELLPGLAYRTYGVTSLNAKGLESGGLRKARQVGNRERAEDWSWVGRVDYTPLAGALLGGSAYLGDQGHNQEYGGKRPGVFMQIYEAHAQVRTHGFEMRALGAVADIDDAEILSADPSIGQTVAEAMLGYYGEVAYDVMPLLWADTGQALSPWFRYSRVDTQNKVPRGFASDEKKDRDTYEVGLTYKPLPEVVLKLDYRLQDAKRGDLPDEIRVGGGFVF